MSDYIRKLKKHEVAAMDKNMEAYKQGRSKPKPVQSGGFMRTESEDKKLRSGQLPAGWHRDESGNARPKVQ